MNTFNAAFDAILKGTGDRSSIAEAQVREFGHRDWTPLAPTRDALDRSIVFKDDRGFTYTVSLPHENGSHVRTYFDTRDSVQSVDLVAYATTWLEADHLLDRARALRSETEVHAISGSRTVGGFFVSRCRVGRPSLD